MTNRRNRAGKSFPARGLPPDAGRPSCRSHHAPDDAGSRSLPWSRDLAGLPGVRGMNDVVMELRQTPGRRWFSVLALLAVSGAAAWFVLFGPERNPGMRALLAAASAGFAFQAWRFRDEVRSSIRLTPEGLFDGGGDCIFRTDNVASVERGLLAMRPSNGFLVRLREPAGIRWIPGTYWRVGRRVGVGGSLRPADVRALSDRLAGLVAENRRAPETGTPFSAG